MKAEMPQTPETRKVIDNFTFHGKPHILETEIDNKSNEILTATLKTPDGEVVKYIDLQMFDDLKRKRQELMKMGIEINDLTALNMMDTDK